MVKRFLAAAALLLAAAPILADAKAEAEYYKITRFQAPAGVKLEVCGTQLLADGRLACCTRRGEIWLVKDPFAAAVGPEQFVRFASGLHEPLSLAERDGWLYAVQRGEVSRLKDTTGDGVADVLEVVSADWGINGDYHEYAFGSKFDSHGDLWVTLCLTGSFSSQSKYRGWCVRVSHDGKLTPTCSGVRSPGGVGANLAGDMFYTDNQGPWNGTCGLKHLTPGKFVGHPGGFKWYDQPEALAAMGKRPAEPIDKSKFHEEAKRLPQYTPPSILFPYRLMGQSAAGLAADGSGGKFGPFAGQMFVGDQTNSTVMRCFLEQVDGHWQGACFPFREGFASGVVGVEIAPRGGLFAGCTARGWGSRGDAQFGVERLDWTGKTPFEIAELKARPDGFELRLTADADPKTLQPGSFAMQAFTYAFQAAYGGPEIDFSTPKITAVAPGADARTFRLKVEGLKEGHIHELKAPGLRSAAGAPLLHPVGYYTLMKLAK